MDFCCFCFSDGMFNSKVANLHLAANLLNYGIILYFFKISIIFH